MKQKPPIYVPPPLKNTNGRPLASNRNGLSSNRLIRQLTRNHHKPLSPKSSRRRLLLAGGSLFSLLLVLLTQNEPVEAYISDSQTRLVESIPIGLPSQSSAASASKAGFASSQQSDYSAAELASVDESLPVSAGQRAHLQQPESTQEKLQQYVAKTLSKAPPQAELELKQKVINSLNSNPQVADDLKVTPAQIDHSINSVLAEEISSNQIAALLAKKQLSDTRSGNQLTSTVREGDSLFKIFRRLNLPTRTLDQIVQSYKSADQTPLRFIYPGQRIHFQVDPKSRLLTQIAFNKNALTRIVIERNQGTFVTKELSNTLKTTQHYAQGVIEGSFYLAAKKAGLSDKTIMEFTDIFAWDVDFTMDLRQRDSFDLIYERQHLKDGSTIPGRILSARFSNRGDTKTALFYKNPNNNRISYYSPEGLSLRKAFLRSPVDFARISSHFNLNRKHPILHTIRAHRGVDYAARRGTPIKTTGNGVIKHIGRKNGFGKTVVIQHGKKYNTLYAHMQGYKKGLKRGDKVKQGDVIGYIGSSGLATGPHLHYEFRVNNVHKDPLKVKFPDAEPIPKKYVSAFKRSAARQLTALNNKGATRLATNTLQ